MIQRTVSSYWLSYGIPQNVVKKYPGYLLPEEIVLRIFDTGYQTYQISSKFKSKLKSFIREILKFNKIEKRGLFYLYIRTSFGRGGMFPIFIGKV